MHIVSWFYTIMYIAPGQWLTTPWGRNFDVNRNILSYFFMILYMYIAPGQAQTTPGDKVLMSESTEMSCHFVHLLQVFKKKKMSLKSDFTHFFFIFYFFFLFIYLFIFFFNDLIHVRCISPRHRGRQPPEDKIWCQQKVLSLYPLAASLKIAHWSLILYIFFFFFSWFNTCI